MTMLGSILSAGAARPGGLLAPTGEGADGAAAGSGEMFAAAIAAASAPAVGGPAGASGANSVSLSAATDPNPALVTEMTLAVLGNGGVARGEAQSLPTPEPLPEKRVLAQAPEGHPSTSPGSRSGGGAGRTPAPLLFDQPVLTKALGSASDLPAIAGADDLAALQPEAGAGGVTPDNAKPARRGTKLPEADALASPAVQSAPMMTAAVALVAPPEAAPPAQPPVAAPQLAPALAVTAQRKSIGAYRAGVSPALAQAPVQAPDAARITQLTPVTAQQPAFPAGVAAGAAPATPAPPAELVARIVADSLRPSTNRGASSAATTPQPIAVGQPGGAVSADGKAGAVASDSGADSIAPATLETPPAIAFATPSPLRASRPAEALRQQSAEAGVGTAAAPFVAVETARDAQRADGGEAAVSLSAMPGVPAPIPAAIAAAPAVDGAARIEASAPAAPRLDAVLSDQVIDMGIDGQWIDRLAREITQVADGTGHSRFQLSPPNLGRIQVDLWQGEAGGRVHLLTETDEAAMRLREGQATLQADARLAALSLGQVVIERAAGGNLDGQRDPNAQSNPQPQSQSRAQDQGQTAQQNGQPHQGQPQAWGQNAAGSGASQGQSGNSGGQHGKSGDPRAVLEERGQDAGTTTGGESRVRYA